MSRALRESRTRPSHECSTIIRASVRRPKRGLPRSWRRFSIGRTVPPACLSRATPARSACCRPRVLSTVPRGASSRSRMRPGPPATTSTSPIWRRRIRSPFRRPTLLSNVNGHILGLITQYATINKDTRLLVTQAITMVKDLQAGKKAPANDTKSSNDTKS